jgi:hypothetical protein
LHGAFSYGILRSPLDYPADRREVQADFNIPVNLAGGARRLVDRMSDSTVVMPALLGRVTQLLNAGVAASAPVGAGVLFFAGRENAGLRVTASLGDASIDLDTVLEAGVLRLKGSAYLPLRLDLRWRSLSFGYVFNPRPWLRLGLQAHRHEVAAAAGGDLRPDLAGRVEVEGAAFDIDYTADRVYGNAEGSYAGVAYTPEMAVEAGPVWGMLRMPASLRARGRLDMDYRVPFFIDPETFENEIAEPDSFLTPENLRRLQGGETRSRTWVFREPLRFSLPGSATLGLRFWKRRLEISYTKMLGTLGVESEPLSADADSAELRSEGFLDAALSPDHLLLFRWETSFFRGCLGAHTVNLAYRGENDLLSGFSPLEWSGDPLAPVLQFGFLWGDPLRFNLDLAITPFPALRSGMRYRF